MGIVPHRAPLAGSSLQSKLGRGNSSRGVEDENRQTLLQAQNERKKWTEMLHAPTQLRPRISVTKKTKNKTKTKDQRTAKTGRCSIQFLLSLSLNLL